MEIVQMKNLDGEICYAIRKRRWLSPDIFFDLSLDFRHYWWSRDYMYYKDCVSTDLEKVKKVFEYLNCKPVVLEQKK